jgi:ribosome-binding factor A
MQVYEICTFAHMETKRQLRISKMLQRELGTIFQLESKAKYGAAMITVTKVHVTKDLALARIYLSLFATKDKEMLLGVIRHSAGEIRYHLGRRIKDQVRHIPELEFYHDDSLDYIENIEQLLDN